MYGKIENGTLVQKQPNKEDGFVKVPQDAICGQVLNGEKFVNPPPAPDMRTYKEKRAEDYPDIGEQLDAIWRMVGRLNSDGVLLPIETLNVLGNINAVKTKYPKDIA